MEGTIGHFRLVLITHDESTFYQNDQQKVYWGCPGQNIILRPKGEGLTLMVSDFLTTDWGPLHHHNGRCVVINFLPSKSLTHLQRSLVDLLAWEE